NPVPDSAYREEVFGLARVSLELLTKVPDVDVDGARLAVRRVAPEGPEEHLAREDAARLGRKGPEQLELDVGQLHRLAAEIDRSLGGIEAEISRFDNLTVLLRTLARQRGAPEESTDPGAELADRARLRDVVVGAE